MFDIYAFIGILIQLYFIQLHSLQREYNNNLEYISNYIMIIKKFFNNNIYFKFRGVIFITVIY